MDGWFCWVIRNKPFKEMKYLLKHLKLIAYLLVSLILFQSCVVYNKTPTSIEKASQYNNHKMKIKTYDGDKYKLRWIDEKDGNVVEKPVKLTTQNRSKVTRGTG